MGGVEVWFWIWIWVGGLWSIDFGSLVGADAVEIFDEVSHGFGFLVGGFGFGTDDSENLVQWEGLEQLRELLDPDLSRAGLDPMGQSSDGKNQQPLN